MKNLETKDPDLLISDCLDNSISFSVIAGAGSGKTSSLIKALKHVRSKKGSALRTKDQKIACITYTNVAKEVIKNRTEADELFAIHTIHDFCWSLISRYQSNIQSIVKTKIIPQRIEKKIESGISGNSQKAIKNRAQIERLTQALEKISDEIPFEYSLHGRDYINGKLDHDDIIDITTILILENDALRKITTQKYPYIFVDEAQDTFPNVINALNRLSAYNELPVVGYFGDPLQQIYEKRAGAFFGPQGSAIITKNYNYRCSHKVIDLLNSIRPELLQEPGPKNEVGSVQIHLIQAEPGEGPRNTYTDDQLNKSLKKFDATLEQSGWGENDDRKFLFLTRQMIAHRLKFSILNKLFTGPYSSKASEDQFKEGSHFLLTPFFDVLIPLLDAKKGGDWTSITSIMRTHSPLLKPDGKNQSLTIRQLILKINSAIEAIESSWTTTSTKRILLIASEHELVDLPERLQLHLHREPRAEIYDEDVHTREKGDWLVDEFFKLGTEELSSFKLFISKMTPYSTQHGVKGDEFGKVVVVFDDTEANWNNYSFSRLLTPITAQQQPTEGQKSKSLNLAYVCFSRAIKDLKIILYTSSPEIAKKELLDKKLFLDSQIHIVL